MACYRPGDRPHLFYHLLVYRRRKGEAKGFTWSDYRDLIIAAHWQAGRAAGVVLGQPQRPPGPGAGRLRCGEPGVAADIPAAAYAPELNPAEGIWSLLKRAMVNFAAADLAGLVRIVKRS